MNNRPWTPADEALLRRLYPDHSTAELAHLLRRTAAAVGQRAIILGVRKSAAFVATLSGRYQPGAPPPNKGLRRPPGWAPGRMAHSQFKPGRPAWMARNYRPIGSYRIGKDRILQKKFTDDPSIYPARRWAPVQRLVWEAAHGPVPAGHIVVFRPGQHTTDPALITLDRLDLISKAENMRRNSIHTRLPAEVVDIIRLTGALKRKIRKKDREQPPQ